MKELNIPFKDNELRILFDYFDADHSNSIDFDEFIQGIRDPLSPERLKLVKYVFSLIDVDGNGIVDSDEIAHQFDPSNHPEVLAGRKTARAVLTEFLKTFEIGQEFDDKVTEAEFINYYTNIGASIDNDNYFEAMIRNTWHIDNNFGTVRSQNVINNDTSGIVGRLQSQGILPSSLELFNQEDLLDPGKFDIASGNYKSP